MTDPLQPAGEWHMCSVEELVQMEPAERQKYVDEIAAYIANLPLPPAPSLDPVAIWEMGYKAGQDSFGGFDAGYKRKPKINPYRSEP